MDILSAPMIAAVLGSAAAAPAGERAAVAATQIHSVWDFVVKGGPMMIPIGLCSLIALTVIAERLVSLRRRNIIPPAFLPGLETALKAGGRDHAQALAHCRDDGSPLAVILEAAIRRLSEPLDLLERHIQEAGQRAVFKMRKYLRALNVIAAICPLMGLLGTIFGMIKAFQTVASSGEALGKTELLAEGIYEALITTAAGLLVAIPVVIAYQWIAGRIDHLVDEMDRLTVAFVEQHARRDSAARRTEETRRDGGDGSAGLAADSAATAIENESQNEGSSAAALP
ncbi:MAG: MotA/TolQ/ExbB proton channel family protein [Phycisphaerae bacterium]